LGSLLKLLLTYEMQRAQFGQSTILAVLSKDAGENGQGYEQGCHAKMIALI